MKFSVKLATKNHTILSLIAMANHTILPLITMANHTILPLITMADHTISPLITMANHTNRHFHCRLLPWPAWPLWPTSPTPLAWSGPWPPSQRRSMLVSNCLFQPSKRFLKNSLVFFFFCCKKRFLKCFFVGC